jgi:hypothetical protein
MSSLPNDRWRAFVVALCEQPVQNYAKAAATADPEVWGKTPASAKNAGHRLAHDERIQAAILEEGQRRVGAAVAISIQKLVEIADAAPELKDRLKAINMILNRAGLPEVKESRVKTERVLSEGEKIESIIAIAEKLKLDPRALLGNAGISIPERLLPAPAEKVVDAEFTPVEKDDWSTL